MGYSTQVLTRILPGKTRFIYWWRRGRVELPVQRRQSRIYYRFIRLFLSHRVHSNRPEFEPGQPIKSFTLPIGVSRMAPRYFVTHQQPTGVRLKWMSRLF